MELDLRNGALKRQPSRRHLEQQHPQGPHVSRHAVPITRKPFGRLRSFRHDDVSQATDEKQLNE